MAVWGVLFLAFTLLWIYLAYTKFWPLLVYATLSAYLVREHN
jgi:hypothetical protein